MRHFRPGSHALLVLRLRCAILAVPAAFLCGAAAAFSVAVCIAASVILALLFVFAVLFYLPRLVRSCQITQAQEITISYGVFFTKTNIVPRNRILWMECAQTPLTKWFGLCSLHLYAARSSVKLWLLAQEDSEQLWDIIDQGEKSRWVK